MASSARIEELERKFNENPRRYFAPLANEYRKAGDLEQAIAICRTYVPQQPAHMSGHIVFGQALFEAGEHEEARGVFEAALALDPENLIALRHLGDIARERGELAAARTWYQRVLDADPRNEEVTALLATLDASGRDAAEVPTWAEINPERTLELPPALLESATRQTVIADTVAGISPPGTPIAPVSSAAQTLQPPPPTVPRAGWPQEMPVLAEEIPGPGLVDIEPLELHASKPPQDAASVGGGVAPPPPSPVQAPTPPVDLHGSLAPAQVLEPPPSPPVVAGASRDADQSPATWAMLQSEDADRAPEHAEPAAGLEPMEFVAPPPPEAGTAAVDSRAVTTGDETPGVFVTETMAELYLQQGFRDEALSVYRQLLTQNPGDATLQQRVAQLESSAGAFREDSTGADVLADGPAHAPTIRAFFARLATRRWNGATHGAGAMTLEPPHAYLPPSETEGGRMEPGDPGEVPGGGPHGEEAHPLFAATPAGTEPIQGHPEAATPPGIGVANGVSAVAEHTAVGAMELDHASVEITHELPADPAGELLGTVGARIMDAFGYAAGASVVGIATSEYDVASYDAADMSGALGTIPPPAVPEHAASPEAPAEATAEPPPAAELSPAVASAPPDAAGDQRGSEGAEANGVGPADAPRRPMQTGSVNVLFPPQSVPAADETAAATLSGAYGGPTEPGAAVGAGRPARTASNELSLDSIFREAAPPPEAPRREASAFSFDQFFTETAKPASGGPAAGGPAPAPRDKPADDLAGDAVSDAEQFSNWLAGLKKK